MRRSKRKERLEAEVGAALAEFTAAVEARVQAELERSQETQLALVDALRGLQAELDNRDQALAFALERIGRAIDHSTEVIAGAGASRRELVDALGQLTRALPLAAPPAAPAPRIAPPTPVDANTASNGPRDESVGGTVLGGELLGGSLGVVTSDIDLGAAERGSEHGANGLTERAAPETRPNNGIEVQCRFEGQWIDGFEVFEIIQEGGRRRYRLRRISDGVVMPSPYLARDVRPKADNVGPRYLRARSSWTRG